MFKQSKVQIESLRAMDSRVMQKQGIFKNGAGSYYWRDAETKEMRANIDYSYQDQQLTLSYRCNGESYCYVIRIDRTVCHYGGTRSWFICPSQQCRKRVAKLYFSESGYFTCRHCNNANYAIQQMSEKDKPRYHMHCIDRLKMSHAHSVTFDNGKEFSEHQRLTNQGIDTYFADAYCSNQRARNENTNGLIRQYLPKSSSFEHISQERIQEIEDALNSRPRKSLGWRTPSEVMAGFYTVDLLVESA